MIDDDTIQTLVARLSRTQRNGGRVIERAAILAEGADSSSILAWIVAHDWHPEAQTAGPVSRGLHGTRLSSGGEIDVATPQRYVLAPGD